MEVDPLNNPGDFIGMHGTTSSGVAVTTTGWQIAFYPCGTVLCSPCPGFDPRSWTRIPGLRPPCDSVLEVGPMHIMNVAQLIQQSNQSRGVSPRAYYASKIPSKPTTCGCE